MSIQKKKKRGTSTKQKVVTYAILGVLVTSLLLTLFAAFSG